MSSCSRFPAAGVPVAYEIARELKAPLDVFVVRKLGVPWQPELAMGAIAGQGHRSAQRRCRDGVQHSSTCHPCGRRARRA